MRALLQRVSAASVQIDGLTHSQIGGGLLVLLGIEAADTPEDLDWLVKKIVQLRIFSDEAGHMNLAIQEHQGEVLVVSQFTLFAATKKGNRPSFIRAARPEQAIPLYELFLKNLSEVLGKPVQSGVFGADMKVNLINDGPVTIWIDTKAKE